jgi:hypothetical protein
MWMRENPDRLHLLSAETQNRLNEWHIEDIADSSVMVWAFLNKQEVIDAMWKQEMDKIHNQ